MMSADKPPSPFVPVENVDGNPVMLRAARYGLALDFNGEPYLPGYAGSWLIGRFVMDFLQAETEGRA